MHSVGNQTASSRIAKGEKFRFSLVAVQMTDDGRHERDRHEERLLTASR